MFKKNLGIITVIISGCFEYFDFMIYVFFSEYLTKIFLPNQQSGYEFLSFLILAAGYGARPIGGIIFGQLGDKKGRTASFYYTLSLIFFSSIFILFIPSFSRVGILAAFLLIGIRFLQGISVGGELPCSITYAMEKFKHIDRKRMSSYLFIGFTSGIILAATFNYTMKIIFTEHQILEYAWRIPFICGSILLFIPLFLRKSLNESEDFIQILKDKKVLNNPILEIFKKNYKNIFIGLFIAGFPTTVYQTVIIFFPKKYFPEQASGYTVLAMTVACIFSILFSKIFQKISSFRLFYIGVFLNIISISGFLYIISLTQNASIFLILIIFCAIAMAASFACTYSCTFELFDTNVRETGIGLCFNFANLIFTPPAAYIAGLDFKYVFLFFISMSSISLFNLKFLYSPKIIDSHAKN